MPDTGPASATERSSSRAPTLAEIRQQRDQRRLDCAAFQADLHATPDEHTALMALKAAARAGTVTLPDAIEAVNALRRRQQQAA